MTLTATIGLLLGLALGGSLVLLAVAWRGWRPPLRPARRSGTVWNRDVGRRALLGLAAAVGVALITRWPVAAIAAGVTIYLWPTMFGAGSSGRAQVERLEALAVWTESLRDSIAGSVGLEQAIQHSRVSAPAVLQPSLQRLETQMSIQVPLPEALTSFAEEFDDASADLVVAALILNSRLRGRGLAETLTRLATSAREEVEMRRRIEEGRRALRRNALIVIGVTAAFAGGVTVLSPDYVRPYSTPTGQLVLLGVLAVFAAGLMWMRTAATVTPPERFLADSNQVARTAQPTSAGESQ